MQDTSNPSKKPNPLTDPSQSGMTPTTSDNSTTSDSSASPASSKQLSTDQPGNSQVPKQTPPRTDSPKPTPTPTPQQPAPQPSTTSPSPTPDPWGTGFGWDNYGSYGANNTGGGTMGGAGSNFGSGLGAGYDPGFGAGYGGGLGGGFGGGYSLGAGTQGQSTYKDKTEMVKQVYLDVLGKEPDSRAINYYKYSTLNEDQIRKQLIESAEHRQVIKDANDYPDIKTKLEDAESELKGLRAKIEDWQAEFDSLNLLLSQKNEELRKLRDEMNSKRQTPGSSIPLENLGQSSPTPEYRPRPAPDEPFTPKPRPATESGQPAGTST